MSSPIPRWWMIRLPKLSLFIIVGLALFVGCGKRKAPSPMKDESIVSSHRLHVGIFDYGSELDTSALASCSDQFPSVEILNEKAVHRSLRDSGLNPERVFEFGDHFDSYLQIRGFHLLVLAFEADGKSYLRMVNYIGRYVSTVLLDVKSPTCGDFFRAQRFLVVESHPPLADVFVDERPIGEAPVWTWLRDGTYEVTCKLTGQFYKPIDVKIPSENRVTCYRENMTSEQRAKEEEKMSAEEGAGVVLLTIIGIAGSIAVALLPILFLL